MNKKITISLIVFLTIVASILSFYFAGCVATGIFNKAQGLARMFVMLTPGLAGIIIPVELIIFLFLIIRLSKRPNAIKRFLKTYSISLLCLSVLGLVFAILAGVLMYKSFVEPSPFPGFLIIAIIWHVLIIVLSVVTLTIFRKRIQIVNEDNKGRGVLHGFWTAGLAIIVFYALNRFGALLISPFYIQWRTLDLTWPFYITLLSLIAFVVQGFLYNFNIYNTSKKKTIGIIITAGLLLCFAGAFIATAIIGYNNPLFLSAVSPAVPFERMLTKPVEFVLHSLATIVSAGVVLFISIRSKIKDHNSDEPVLKTEDIINENKTFEIKVEEIKEEIKIDSIKEEVKVIEKEIIKEEPKSETKEVKETKVEIQPKKVNKEVKVVKKPVSKKVINKKEDTPKENKTKLSEKKTSSSKPQSKTPIKKDIKKSSKKGKK